MIEDGQTKGDRHNAELMNEETLWKKMYEMSYKTMQETITTRNIKEITTKSILETGENSYRYI